MKELDDFFEIDLGCPENWTKNQLKLLVDKISVNGKKIKTSSYQRTGEYPVIDQGSEFISGFYNDERYLIKVDKPIVVFGDHTRVVKFVDFDFVPGADGVKPVKAKDDLDERFFYHLINYLSILLPSKGYARHYQYIENSKVSYPSKHVQVEIVKKIDNLFYELTLAQQELKETEYKLHLYKQSIVNSATKGRLTINDPLLESAAKIIEQIKVEKERLSAKKLIKKAKKFAPILPTDVPFSIPRGWVWVYLGEILAEIQAGKSFSCEERPPTMNEIGVAKVSAISSGVYKEEESKTCKIKSRINSDYFIAEKDLLMSRANTIKLVGTVVFVKKVNKKIMLSDKTLRLKPLIVNRSWLFYTLSSHIVRGQIEKVATGTKDGMRNITQQNIMNILVPVPPLYTQEKIVEVIDRKWGVVDDVLKEISKLNNDLKRIKQSVYKKAFEGNLL